MKQKFTDILYIKFFERLLPVRSTSFFKVNLKNHWFKEILKYNKGRLAFMVIANIFSALEDILLPFLLAYSINNQSFTQFVLVICFFVLSNLFYQLGFVVGVNTDLRIKGSFAVSIEKYILSVDPVYHSTKSTGSLLSQIDSGINGFSELIYGLFYFITSFIPIIIGTSLILASFGGVYGLISLSMFSGLTVFSGLFYYYNAKSHKPKLIKNRKEKSRVNTENILQIPYIRSLFVTKHRIKMFAESVKNFNTSAARLRIGTISVRFFSRVIQYISLLLLGYLIFQDSLDPVLALGILVSFYQAISKMQLIGNTVSKSTETILEINDMYSTIQEYGSQNFPV